MLIEMSDENRTIHVGLLLYPGLTQLDLTGPYEVLHRLPGAMMHTVWKSRDVLRADSGLALVPSMTMQECPQLDILCVPGGYGQVSIMDDAEVLTFLRNQGEHARYVTSVCTGSLLLGAAGLLRGYRATTHWAYTELLDLFGATYTKGRVVSDRNRITAGGVTAGIDFGLQIVANLAGEDTARMIELGIEYNPAPPFRCGHPDVADPNLVALAKDEIRDRVDDRRARIASQLQRRGAV